MTGRQVLIASVVAFAIVALPHRAEADWWPRWLGFLEELSGPGPFKGARLGIVLACLPTGEPRATIVFAAREQCWKQQPVPEIVFEFSQYASLRNSLFPEDPESEFARVRIQSFEGSLLFPLGGSSVVHAGGGVGLQRFSGDAFGSFYRPSINGNLRIYPLGEVNRRWLKRLVVLSWVPTLIFPGYDWEDFGAPPGTFSESVDVLTGRLHITFDLSGLIQR